jgi:hypothetical protein
MYESITILILYDIIEINKLDGIRTALVSVYTAVPIIGCNEFYFHLIVHSFEFIALSLSHVPQVRTAHILHIGSYFFNIVKSNAEVVLKFSWSSDLYCGLLHYDAM